MREQESARFDLDPDARVLREDDLDCVSGGKVEHQDFVFVHKLDKASPVLFQS
jgi:type VI protein secretion system component Hcp